VYNAKFFGKKKRAKSKYRAVPTAGDDTPNNGSEFDPRGESDAVGITETDGQWIAKFEWMWKLNQRPDPVPVIERRWHWKNIDTDSAPEIEYRVQRAASRYFDLSVPPRYRAPHAKVRELSKKGLTQKQIARKLKVKERTIRNRLAELPPEPPKETIAADLLPLIVARGGGWAKGNSWPGGENTPRGSTESHPQDADQLGTRKGAEWISPRNDGNFNHAVDYQADGYARFSLPWTGCSHPAYALECSPVRCGRCGAEC